MIPNKLKIGDTIGVVAPSDPLIEEDLEALKRAKEIVERSGFRVKYAKNLFSNTNGYSNSAKEKAQDIHEMFQDKEVKMIWCACGGNNSNNVFEYLDYEIIKKNPKIVCGYSDITSITNVITAKTSLVTFSGTNFKTIANDETDYSYQEVLKRLVEGSLELGRQGEEYKTIQEGQAQGELIGGNLCLMHEFAAGAYKADFNNKILFLEELGLESPPAIVSNHLAFMKQNGVFDQIRGLWIGNYEQESGISLEKIVADVLELPNPKYGFPIIKSNNFGHIETKTVIPIGTKAKIDTNQIRKIELMENCVKEE